MCIIDRKTYQYPDGRRQLVETTTRCNRAISAGKSICKDVHRREVLGAQLVETRPSHDRSPSDPVLVAEGSVGRQRLSRDVSSRSSNSSSIHRSNTMSQRSSISVPSSASSPSYSETKTAGPSPPPLGSSMSSPLERARQPYPPPPQPPAANMIITPDGTAQYSRPPSLSMERASENERPSTSAGERSLPRQDSSFDSMKGNVDDAEEVTPKAFSRRPSLKIKTGVRPSRSSSSPSVESPGLSSLPGVGHFRKDSANPRPDKGKKAHFSSDSTREKRKDKDSRSNRDKPRRRDTAEERLQKEAEERRRREEDERQARLERARLEQSDLRQSAREKLVREAAVLRESLKSRPDEDTPSDASRERHRQAAYSALEREPDYDDEEDDSILPFVEAEEAQMQRERAAAARRRESANKTPAYFDDRTRRTEPVDDFPSTYVNDQLRRDADARAQYEARRPERRPERRPSKRISDRPAPRARAYTYDNTNTSPVSIRSPVPARAQPVVHQQPPKDPNRPLPSARHSGTIPQRGAEVIANAQARGSRGSDNMNDAFANLTMSGGLGDQTDPAPAKYYYDAQGRKRYL